MVGSPLPTGMANSLRNERCLRTEAHSSWILLVARDPRGQLHPCVSSAFIDRVLGRRKARISKRTYRNRYVVVLPFFGVEYGASADGAKPEAKGRSMVAG